MNSYVDQYNVIWNTQSNSSEDSMPCGGGGVGLNVWVENGEILFYLARSGTFDENNSLLKLGRVRLRLSPNPFEPGMTFQQELRLRDGSVWITGEGNAGIHIWAEVTRPVIHIEVWSAAPTVLTAAYENWRTQDRLLGADERHQCMSFLGTAPEQFPIVTRRDECEPGENQILWYHRNDNRDLVFDKEVTQQHLESVRNKLWNPLRDLTFGGVLRGSGMAFRGSSEGVYQGTAFTAWSLQSENPAPQHSLQISLHTEQSEDLEQWKQTLRYLAKSAASSDDADFEKNKVWWQQFWERSHVVLNPNAGTKDTVWQIGRNYQLFRYMLGCNANGEYPSKFNGDLFTFDAPPFTPDFRKWGGGSFTAQNQRLLYWPMLKSGDFDLMLPQFEFYRRALGNAERRTLVYWGHAGAGFTEQIENFGLPIGEIYERAWGGHGLGPRPGDETDADRGVLQNEWCEDVYDTVLEFCLMLMDWEQFAAADISGYLPLLESCVQFFDAHYQWEHRQRTGQALDDQGKLVIFPGSACETYKRAVNPSSTVAGLLAVLTRMRALPLAYGSAEQRAGWQAMLDRVPPLPFREKEGRRTIAPAETWERINNTEFPQMYPVFPYGLYGLGRPDIETALATWQHGADIPAQGQGNFGWNQNAIWCARLGLTEQAQDLILAKLADSGRRFPAFWGPNYDWTPDFNHGGSAMIALQEMLLQTDGREIRLLPGWPKEWDVDFKLHAPYQTVVECGLRGGKIAALQFTPSQRREDVAAS
jgi:hypothetical protein